MTMFHSQYLLSNTKTKLTALIPKCKNMTELHHITEEIALLAFKRCMAYTNKILTSSVVC